MRRARVFSLGALVVWAGCGPAVTEERELPQTCGEDGAVRLLDDLAFGVAVFAGERLLVQTGSTFPLTPTSSYQAFTMGPCGEDPVVLPPPDFGVGPFYAVAGSHMLLVQASGDLEWVDPVGHVPNHPLIEGAGSCLLPVGGGLVAQTLDSAVVFHPDPSRPDVMSQVLVEHALEPDIPFVPLVEADVCGEFGTKEPVLDGEGVLVAEANGGLIRIDPRSGERQTVIDARVGEFVLLDDPRYILWRGSVDDDEDDCCDLQVLDRDSGTHTYIRHGLLSFDISWMGEWLWSLDFGGPVEDWRFAAYHYATDTWLRLDGWWDLQAPLSSSSILVHNPDQSRSGILDVGSTQPRGIDFPKLPWPPRTYDDGVVALRTASPDATRGDLMRLPFDTLRPTVQAEDVPGDWVRTHGGNVLFIDRDDPEDLGPLILVERDGRRRELATDVSSFNVPHHGTDHERNEAFYFVADGDDRGMWRLVLP